jgi:hypothetical protein
VLARIQDSQKGTFLGVLRSQVELSEFATVLATACVYTKENRILLLRSPDLRKALQQLHPCIECTYARGLSAQGS